MTTVRDGARQAPDFVDHNFAADRPNLLWVADITYIPTWNRPCRYVRMHCRQASLRPASLHQPRRRPPAPSGCTKSSTRGFRVIVRKNDKRVKLYSRPGNDLTYRFPLIVEAVARLRARSCIIDGEAVACARDGVSSFNLIRHRQHDGGAGW
jgi:ATP dependent DNA ligase domain